MSFLQVKGQKGGYKFEKLPYNPFITRQQQQQQQQHVQQKELKDSSLSPLQCNPTSMVSEMCIYVYIFNRFYC